MKPEATIDNRIFLYAFAGVIFLVAAILFVIVNHAGFALFEPLDLIVTSVLGAASLSLLTKAVRGDKERLRQQL